MSVNTDPALRDLFIYQVYVRNHTPEGTFEALEKDLPRIRDLGTDIVYLLPVHPIGEKNRKGELGSPYSISDYEKINPELGTMDDFKSLIRAIHAQGMKVMMDIVFNHTSYDSKLFNSHKTFFYEKNGRYTNRIGDWWDVVDFDFTKDPRLTQYLKGILTDYTALGVDGFRFDVPSLLPLSFLKEAKEAVLKINPNSIWLSESVHGHFLRAIRNRGFEGLSESELFQVFDLAYDYDAHPAWERYLKGEGPLEDYVGWLNLQEEIYPKNYVKLRNLENHDFGRFAAMVGGNETKLRNWHAFSFFSKGATMIYAGGESFTDHHPDLFNKDTLKLGNNDFSALIRRLKDITTGPLFTGGIYEVRKAVNHDVLIASYETIEETVTGIFNVGAEKGYIELSIPSGTYRNLVDDIDIVIESGKLPLAKTPAIIKSKTVK